MTLNLFLIHYFFKNCLKSQNYINKKDLVRSDKTWKDSLILTTYHLGSSFIYNLIVPPRERTDDLDIYQGIQLMVQTNRLTDRQTNGYQDLETEPAI